MDSKSTAQNDHLKTHSIFPPDLPLKKILWLLSYPNWNKVLQVIDYTRSYEVGLQTGLNILKILENNIDQIPSKKYKDYIKTIYLFILQNLDKLDLWEEYLSAWEGILKNTNLSMTYSKESKKFHGKEFESFILSEDANYIYVNILWTLSHRKKIIERKLAKKKKGTKIGNLLHKKQEELSLKEIQERYNWIIKFVETGVYDFDPPASRQQKRRQNEKEIIIDI